MGSRLVQSSVSSKLCWPCVAPTKSSYTRSAGELICVSANAKFSSGASPGPSVRHRTPPSGRGSPVGVWFTIDRDQTPLAGGALNGCAAAAFTAFVAGKTQIALKRGVAYIAPGDAEPIDAVVTVSVLPKSSGRLSAHALTASTVTTTAACPAGFE